MVYRLHSRKIKRITYLKSSRLIVNNKPKILYEKYKELVFNVALHYTQNIEDAEEITQDVFISIFENIKDFREESTLKTWAYRITINKSLDFGHLTIPTPDSDEKAKISKPDCNISFSLFSVYLETGIGNLSINPFINL